MTAMSTILLDGEEVSPAAFDVAGGTVDLFVIGGDGKAVIQNGRPMTERRTGKVTITWSAAAIALASGRPVDPAQSS